MMEMKKRSESNESGGSEKINDKGRGSYCMKSARLHSVYWYACILKIS